MRIQNLFTLGVLLAGTTLVGCGSNGDNGGTLPTNVGGKANGTGGGTAVNTSSGGSTGTSTTAKTGGATSNPGGGTTSTATGGNGNPATGGNGNPATGGSGNTPTGGSGNTPTGGSGNTPTGGKTSTGGSGNTPTGGTSTGAGGTTTGVGGATNVGGTSAAVGGTTTVGGGAAVTPATPTCPTGNSTDGVPFAAITDTSLVISDFEKADATVPCVKDPQHLANPCSDSHLITYKRTGGGGTLWYGYTDYSTDADTATTTSRSLPTLTWESTGTGTCTPGGVLHIKGVGNTGWGSGIGVDLAPRTTGNKKQTFDASKYTGVGFNMKCSADVGYLYLKLIDANNDGDCDAASCGITQVCTYSGTTNVCNQYGYKNAWITKNWANYELYFDDALQDPNQPLSTTALNKAKLTALQFQFNTGYDTSGGGKVATAFDCYIDDVHFLTSTPPAPKTTCSTAYTTSGNKIMCGSTQKIFRGVARPSMEWDTSGWNVMPWDMARIKNVWNANVVRIGLNQDFYTGKTTASTGQIYPKYVQRAVRWAEAYGMDVILDLHWVDAQHPSSTSGYMASASTGSTTFWQSLATQFKSDNHVMFELYNEPTISSWSDWKTNYTAMYNSVRTGAGAQQIVIIGGLDWAYDLSGVQANAISGSNIVYNTHPYANKAPSSDWDAKFGTLSATLPVMATEFGSYDCNGTWTTPLIAYFESHKISWTAWGWYAGGGCSFPSLISSYDGTVLAGGNGAASKTAMAANQ